MGVRLELAGVRDALELDRLTRAGVRVPLDEEDGLRITVGVRVGVDRRVVRAGERVIRVGVRVTGVERVVRVGDRVVERLDRAGERVIRGELRRVTLGDRDDVRGAERRDDDRDEVRGADRRTDERDGLELRRVAEERDDRDELRLLRLPAHAAASSTNNATNAPAIKRRQVL